MKNRFYFERKSPALVPDWFKMFCVGLRGDMSGFISTQQAEFSLKTAELWPFFGIKKQIKCNRIVPNAHGRRHVST